MIIKTSYPFMKPPPSARLIRGHRLSQGLAGLWPFGENGGLQVFDLSGNGNDGPLGGNVAWTTGKFGSALDFPGAAADAIEIGKVVFDCSKPFSISVWINPDSAGGQDAFITRYRGSTEGIILRRKTDTALDIWLSNAITTLSTTVSNGTWYHVFVTYDGTKTYAYINAILDAAYPVTRTLIDPGTEGLLQIGKSSLGNYDGQLDNLIIWQRYFTASEIVELYLRLFATFERRARTALMSGYEVVAPPVGMAGAMTTNTGYWGY